MSQAPSSIVEAFLISAERRPTKVCLLFEGTEYSYGRLRELALQWAGAFRRWGVAPGDRVALFLENSPTFLAAYLGVHLAGAIVVLVNAQYRQTELRHLLADAGVRVCVTDAARRFEVARVTAELPALAAVIVVGGVTNLAAQPPVHAADEFLEAAEPLEPFLPDPESIAVIAYTSGTTGRSKGAMLLHRNLAANSVAVTHAWRWTESDRLLLTLPLFHAHGLFVGTHGTWLTGSTAELRRRFEAAEVYDTLLAGEATMFFGVPTMYTRLIAEAKLRERRPAPIRLYVSGSAPLSVQTFDEFDQLFGQRILERYGMTETIMNLTNPYGGERRPGTVGLPFPDQEARIVDLATRAAIADDRPGEIQVRGPHVFPGYWQRPDATAEAFDAAGWFNTGDLGWRSRDGYYTICGRARELIITGGYNVYPREVEDALESHPQVAEAAVFGLPDPEFGEQVVAVVVCRPAESSASPPSADDLIAHCRDLLASYKKPRQVIFVDQLPRNALGKVQKHVLQNELAH
jgi:malonyl-CoA/methylmalonyl-CoA synthetase